MEHVPREDCIVGLGRWAKVLARAAQQSDKFGSSRL